MDTNLEKVEMIQMLLRLKTAEELTEVRELLENLLAEEVSLGPAHHAILDERARRHHLGESKFYTREEVRADIAKLRNLQ
jgi:endonuclease III-like uncharacterized protein